MEEPHLLVPAIVAFGLLLVGLALTIREFYSQRRIGPSPVKHTPTVVDPSPEQREVLREEGR